MRPHWETQGRRSQQPRGRPAPVISSHNLPEEPSTAARTSIEVEYSLDNVRVSVVFEFDGLAIPNFARYLLEGLTAVSISHKVCLQSSAKCKIELYVMFFVLRSTLPMRCVKYDLNNEYKSTRNRPQVRHNPGRLF